jgi:hypothetical protein
MSANANARNRKRTARRRKLPEHEIGSGNVFADIGMPDPELELAKASVAAAIIARIHSLQLSQIEAASRMGIDQPRVSKIKFPRSIAVDSASSPWAPYSNSPSDSASTSTSKSGMNKIPGSQVA